MSDSQTKVGQKVVFIVASFQSGQIHLIGEEYDSYPKAEESITQLPAGTYQVQKVFIRK